MEKIKQYLYYIIIAIISMIALFFFPMLGSTVNAEWVLPTTTVGWIIWSITKLIIVVLNILIFHCFILQAKENIKDNDKYKEANNILARTKSKEYKPRSPEEFFKKEYSGKGISLAIFTALSTIALTQAILTFDWVSMLTYFFTILFGIIFGILEMKKTESFWTEEYYDYAKKIELEKISEDENNDTI